LDLLFKDDLMGEPDPDDMDRIASWGAPPPPPEDTEEPLMIGSWSELGGSPFLEASDALLRLFVSRGDMNAMLGRPPGVADSASWRSAFRSSSRLMSLSAECNALATGLD
jgi:hypothetical protein